MMKKLLLLFALAIFAFATFSAPVSPESAQKVAVTFYKHYAVNKTDYSITDIVARQKDGLTTFYIFIFNAGGFVMVAADDAAIPILGYSVDEPFDKNNIPPNAEYWYEQYSEQIKYIVDSKLDNSQTLKEWDNIRNNRLPSAKSSVAPLCATTWDQLRYYHDLCPADANFDYGHVKTGCIATAMAQIMKRWNYPVTGSGSYTYNCPGYGTQTANFGATTYNWASMPNSVTSANTAVATLMYHCGVSVNMMYNRGGYGYSDGCQWNLTQAFINNFNYSPSAEIKDKANFTSTAWINMLKAEMDASRPVLYLGSGNYGGHAFVCDGYDASNKFHFNWGWSGMDDGYYAIGSLYPQGVDFNKINYAVIRIKPPSNAPIADFTASTATPAVGDSVNFFDASANNPTSWSWEFEGGNPSTSTDQNPANITYSTNGKYRVTLTVSNADGTDTKNVTQYIIISSAPLAWIKQNTGFTNSMRGIDQISIVNPNVVWAKAFDGTSRDAFYSREFTRTVDGGNIWIPGEINFQGSINYCTANIFAVNDTTAFAALYMLWNNGGIIVKTTDGGLTWASANSPSFTNSWLSFVHFFNVNDGVCMGDPTSNKFIIYTTSNGGSSWTQVTNIPTITSGESIAVPGSYDASGNTIWFGSANGRVYKSTDKGHTWTVSSTGINGGIRVVFKDTLTGFALQYASSVMKKTTDGGATWSSVSTPAGYFVTYPLLDFISGTSSVWVNVGESPDKGSSYSNDECTSFKDIDKGSVQYTCVSFYDINTGWAGSYNADAHNGGIYKWKLSQIGGIDEPQSANDSKMTIYPNPAINNITIKNKANTTCSYTLSLKNIQGQEVLSEKINFTATHSIDVSSLSNGVYILSLQNDKENYVSRVVLQR